MPSRIEFLIEFFLDISGYILFNVEFFNASRLQLGSNSAVILNDYDAIKDAFSNDVLLGKPHQGQFSIYFRTSSKF